MAARGLALLAGGIVVGAAIGLAIGASALLPFGGASSPITLSTKNGSCEVDKDSVVVAKKNKQVTWEVKNNCQDPQTVIIGNFRTDPTTTNTNCAQATFGGATSPFQQDDEPRRTAMVASGGGTGDITLKVRSSDDLGPNALLYYYNICLGTTIKDPILVIER